MKFWMTPGDQFRLTTILEERRLFKLAFAKKESDDPSIVGGVWVRPEGEGMQILPPEEGEGLCIGLEFLPRRRILEKAAGGRIYVPRGIDDASPRVEPGIYNVVFNPRGFAEVPQGMLSGD